MENKLLMKTETLVNLANSIRNVIGDINAKDMEVVIHSDKKSVNKINEEIYYKTVSDKENNPIKNVDEVDINIFGIKFKYVAL